MADSLNDIDAVIDLARRGTPIILKDGAGREYLITPEVDMHGRSGSKITPIPSVNPSLPDHIHATVALDDMASFVDYVNTYKAGERLIFARDNELVAKLDWHTGDDAGGGGTDAPSVNMHTARWTIAYSEQWQRWSGISGRWMNQAALAEFLEENMGDVLEPSGANLLEMISNVTSKRKVEFTQSLRLSDGTGKLEYKETETGTAMEMRVPTEIQIGVPVFFGDTVADKVRLFLRYDVDGGKLKFMLKMHQAKLILDAALKDRVEQVRAATGAVVLMGAPT